MSKGIYKNYQINIGSPFQVKNPIGLSPFAIPQLKINEATLHSHDDDDFEPLADTITAEPELEIPTETAEDILNAAREEAQLIIQEAHLEGARYIDNANSEAEQIKKDAYNEAYNLGYEEGKSEAQSEYEALIQEANEIKENAKRDYDQDMACFEADAIRLVLDIAKKVIGEEIKTNKELLINMAAQAFRKCAVKDSITLKVSNEDVEFLNENKDTLLASTDGIGELEIKKDPGLKVGACIVETSFGSLDASVDTKLKMLEEEFNEALTISSLDDNVEDE